MKIWSVSVVMCLVLALGCSTPPKTVTSNESFAITLTHPLHLGGHEYRTISPADVPKLRQLAVTNMWESNLAVAADTLTLTDPNNSHVMVRTVAEYDQIIAKGYFAKTGADIRHEAQFAVASAVLKVVEKAKPVQSSFVAKPYRGIHSLDLLPIDLLPSHESDDAAEHQRRTATGTTLAQLVKEGIVLAEMDKTQSPPKITFHWPGKIFTKQALIKEYGAEQAAELGSVLTVIELARGDFNGDGIEDILVYAIYRFTEGSFVAFDLYLLTRTEAAGLFKIELL